jgi:peptidyl-dipeptidase Dcp
MSRLSLVLLLALVGCPKPAPPPEAAAPAPAPAPAPPVRENPLLKPSTLVDSLPPFDQIKDEDFEPAFTAGMAEQRAEVDAIAKNPEAPSFENTIVALEKSGQTLTRVQKVFFNLNGSNTDDAMQALEEKEAPLLSAHNDAILMDSALFSRVDALWQKRDSLGLDPESAQLLARYHAEFVRAGAKLSDADKATLKDLNGQISTLQTQFEQNDRKLMKDSAVVVDDVAQLDGLSAAEVSAAAEAATARGLTGKWAFPLENTTIQAPLSELKNRELRERIFEASVGRGLPGSPIADNTAIVSKLVDLRAKKAALLGYPTFAAYALEDESAGNPPAVDAILTQLGAPALAQAKKEAAAIQAIIDKQAKAAHTKPFQAQPWDWAFYAEQDRKARFDFDESEVKPYFELEHVVKDGVFYAATQLYGITFTERKDLPVYNPTVRVFEVREADGTPIGLMMLDYFARDNKGGGAWEDTFVDQSGLFGSKPVVVNNLNIRPVAEGQPVLLTFDEVTTAFHEFGHALNALLSNAKYPMLAGTNTPPDFVEYPSQFNEMWAREPAVLANYAKHWQTGEPMPKALFDKVLAAANFGTGYGTLEYLEAASLDMSWHEIGVGQAPPPAGVMDFEAAALKKSGMLFPLVPPRYHTPYFNHAFAGGYEAGYYAYIWSEVLARDTGAWFHAHGGLTRQNGDAFRAGILSRGRTMEPGALFRAFYGKDPEVGPLLAYRGLAPQTQGAGKDKAGKK